MLDWMGGIRDKEEDDDEQMKPMQINPVAAAGQGRQNAQGGQPGQPGQPGHNNQKKPVEVPAPTKKKRKSRLEVKLISPVTVYYAVSHASYQ